MEQKSKKIDVKIIVIVVVVIIAIVEGIVIFTSGNKSNDSKLTQEEQLAVDYLLCNTVIKPNLTEIHRVWVYQEGEKWYFAYDITDSTSSSGRKEYLYGNEEGITLKEMETLKRGVILDYSTLPAKEKGKKLDAEKIQKAFQEQW